MKRFHFLQFCVAITIAIAFVASLAAQTKPDDATKLSPDLAVVPPDTGFLVALNLTKYWDGSEAESLKRLANSHPVVPSWSLRDLPTYTGLQPENVVRMMNFTVAKDAVTTIATKQPYDREKVLNALAPEAVQKSAAGKSYYYSNKSKNAVQLLDDHTLVIGMGHDLAGFLARPALTERDASLDRVLLASQQGAPFVLHAGPNFIRAFAGEKDIPHSPLSAMATARAWQIIATIGQQLTIDLRADFATKEEAEKSTAALALIGEKLTGMIPFYRSHMDPFLKEQEAQYPNARDLASDLSTAFDATAAALKAIQITSAENSGNARIEIKTDKPATTAVLLLTLTPRAAKEKSE
jgi:hypothetical protein